MVDDHHLIGQTLDLWKLVGGQEHAGTLVRQVRNDLPYRKAPLGVYPGRRLVEEHRFGFTYQGKGQGQSLLFPARKPPPWRAGNLCQSDQFQQEVGILGVFEISGKQRQDPARRHRWIYPSTLQHHPHARHERAPLCDGVQAQDAHRSGTWPPVSFESLHRRGLPRTVGSKEGEDTPWFDVKRQAIHSGHVPVANNQIGAVDPHYPRDVVRPTGLHDGEATVERTMIDIRQLREDPEGVKAALARRGVSPDDLDRLLKVDAVAREAVGRRDDLRAAVKELSRQVGEARRGRDDAVAAKLTEQSKAVGVEEQAADAEAESAQAKARELLLWLPNLPADDAPDGVGADDNLEIRRWPDQPRSYLEYQRVPHWDSGVELGLLDLDRGAKLSGSMFPLYRGMGARLIRALTSYALDQHSDAFEEIRPPTLVRTDTMVSTGHLPKFSEEAYHLERDDLWAIPTAEVPLTSMSRGDIMEEADLPLRLTAATPCFRREAGAAGRDTRGLLRLHEFDKVELFAYSTLEQAPDVLADIVSRAEDLLRDLDLEYRVLDLCTGDLGNSARRTFDLEVYSPGCDMWLEVSSVSWCGDYQARRANIRYRPSGGGQPQLVQTLNGSALAWARIWAALIENGRQADGSILLPEVLAAYMGGHRVIEAR